MRRELITYPVLLGFSLAVAYLFYLIWRPFFIPIAWAAIFAILFSPVNRRTQKIIPQPEIRATLLTILVILILVIPTVLLGILLVAEVVSTYELVQNWFRSGAYDQVLQFFQRPFIMDIRDQLDDFIDFQSIDLYSVVSSVMQRLSRFAVSQATDIVQNFSRTLFSFILMVFTLFFFFRDGSRIVEFIRGIIPLSDRRRQEIVDQFSEVITATVLGDLVVALLQGFLGGVAFAVLGLPSPVFWGALMAFLSILPVVGAPLIYMPAGLVLLLQNEYVRGIILLIWGSIVVSQIDNFLRPILISGRTKLHTLVLFFSILGGLYVFGFLGIIAGPMIAALLFTILRMYREKVVESEGVKIQSAVAERTDQSQTEGAE